MTQKYIIFFALFLSILNLNGLEIYKTEAISNNAKTIQVSNSGNWASLPIIDLNDDSFAQINFDILGDKSPTLAYTIIHCNADWTKSSLNEIEYLDGFNNVIIDDYAESFSTNVNYTNYNIQIPNQKQTLKVSGNYVVIVYDNADKSKILLKACFSVVDPKMVLSGTVSSNTDIDTNKSHQQVSFSLDHPGVDIRDVFTDLKIYVRQNYRTDNQVLVDKPTFIQNNRLVYEHNRKLIFEASNQYRRFETVSYKYNPLNIEKIEYKPPYYNATIKLDKIRSDKRYIYDKGQYGRFYIHNAETNGDASTESDYILTSFTLSAPDKFLEPIYLNGEFTNNTFDDTYLMKYDNEKKEYYFSLMLKQGAYNYQYLAKEVRGYTPSLIEGNYYETRNQYSILVYYRPVGSQADLLVSKLIMQDD